MAYVGVHGSGQKTVAVWSVLEQVLSRCRTVKMAVPVERRWSVLEQVLSRCRTVKMAVPVERIL